MLWTVSVGLLQWLREQVNSAILIILFTLVLKKAPWKPESVGNILSYPLMSSRSNGISQNSSSVHILSISLSELHLNLFKVMCGFGVRRGTLEVVPIYFSHSVTHAEWQDQTWVSIVFCDEQMRWSLLCCILPESMGNIPKSRTRKVCWQPFVCEKKKYPK